MNSAAIITGLTRFVSGDQNTAPFADRLRSDRQFLTTSIDQYKSALESNAAGDSGLEWFVTQLRGISDADERLQDDEYRDAAVKAYCEALETLPNLLDAEEPPAEEPPAEEPPAGTKPKANARRGRRRR